MFEIDPLNVNPYVYMAGFISLSVGLFVFFVFFRPTERIMKWWKKRHIKIENDRFVPVPARSAVFCTGCGNQLDWGVNFCPVCGRPFDRKWLEKVELLAVNQQNMVREYFREISVLNSSQLSVKIKDLKIEIRGRSQLAESGTHRLRYKAWLDIDPARKTITYRDKVSKRPMREAKQQMDEDTGPQKYLVSTRSLTHRQGPFKQRYGKVREQIKIITLSSGWRFVHDRGKPKELAE